MTHAIQQTTGTPGGLGQPARRRQALRIGPGAGAGRLPVAPVRRDGESAHDCDGWPGAEFGIWAPYHGETQLSWPEVYHALTFDISKAQA